jgi:hypothetical protein
MITNIRNISHAETKRSYLIDIGYNGNNFSYLVTYTKHSRFTCFETIVAKKVLGNFKLLKNSEKKELKKIAEQTLKHNLKENLLHLY